MSFPGQTVTLDDCTVPTMSLAVVTGASSGIGAACVAAFQRHGASVLGVDRTTSSDADEHLVLDLADDECGDRLLEFNAGWALDVLVNGAGVGYSNRAVETTVTEFDRVLAVNLRAPFLLSSALRDLIAEHHGAIVNVSPSVD